MLPVSLVGDETISGPRYNELASVARGLRDRVAELEEERENLLDEIEGSGELNPYALTVIESAREAQKGASE